MIPGVSCSTCAFFCPPPFAPRGQVQTGQCRRHAPVLIVDDGRKATMWPLTNERAWCGEHSTVEG